MLHSRTYPQAQCRSVRDGARRIILPDWNGTDKNTHLLLYIEPDKEIAGTSACSYTEPEIKNIKDEYIGRDLFRVTVFE